MTHALSAILTFGLFVSLGSGCDRPVTGSPVNGNPTTGVSEPAGDLTKATAPTNSQPPTPNPQPPIETTFDDIKFEMEKTGPFGKAMLTPQIEQLFGQKIRIRGYIYPTLRKRGLKQFVLVRDNLECCFGPGAALFDCILVDMQEGNTAEYTIRPVAVEGIFQFHEVIGPDGKHLAIFRLEGEKVK